MFKSFLTRIESKKLVLFLKKGFSHGPYNPMNYKQKLVGTKLPT